MVEKLEKPEYTPEFRRRRALNWFTLGLTYASMYMARYNFSFANKNLSDTYGWSKAEIGAVISAASLLYGISALFNGPIADKLGGRKAMLIGACGAFVFNLAFGFGATLFAGASPDNPVLAGSLLTYLATVWSLNMYFQSYSALALIKVNSGWFQVSERGVFSAIFGSMIQSGRAAIFAILGSSLVLGLSWQWKFFIPAIAVAIMAVMTFLFVRDTPEDVGFPPLDTKDASSGDTEAITVSYVLKKVFTNPVAITIAVAEFCTGYVRKGFEEWFPRYMQEARELPLDHPIFQKGAMGVVLAGIAGAFAAGFMSDKVFGGRRPPVAFVGYVLQVLCLGVVWWAPAIEYVIIAFTINSLAISMVHSMLSGTASMDFGGKKAAATAAGFFDGMQYVGGSFAGFGMGLLVDRMGWDAWAPSMIGFAAVGMILMIPLWNARPTKGGGH